MELYQVFIVLGIVLIAGAGYFVFGMDRMEDIEFNGFHLSSQNYKAIIDKYPDQRVIQVCDLESELCTNLVSIENNFNQGNK